MVSEFAPAGDQPGAIAALAEGVTNGERYQTLLGITGSGKSATIAWTIEQVQKPTLVIAPNKSLAAQLANEFREFFPDNRVEYFVSYYDYYQPEAYMPSSDTYIEKDSSVNDEIDRLRHSATSALLTRRDVIVVASVSCIYGLGSPEEYRDQLLVVRVGEEHDQRSILTVCAPTADVLGVPDVTVALPRLVGGAGVIETFPLPLSETEQAQLRASATVIRTALDDLDAAS